MNTPRRRRWLPSPSMAVAVIAMVLALGGTATALSGKFSVKRNDIAPKAVSTDKLAGKAVTARKLGNNSVSSGKIRDGSIGSYKLRLNGISNVPSESSTTSRASRSTVDRKVLPGAGRTCTTGGRASSNGWNSAPWKRYAPQRTSADSGSSIDPAT